MFGRYSIHRLSRYNVLILTHPWATLPDAQKKNILQAWDLVSSAQTSELYFVSQGSVDIGFKDLEDSSFVYIIHVLMNHVF